MNSMPFRQLKSFLKILIGVQYQLRRKGAAENLRTGNLPQPKDSSGRNPWKGFIFRRNLKKLSIIHKYQSGKKLFLFRIDNYPVCVYNNVCSIRYLNRHRNFEERRKTSMKKYLALLLAVVICLGIKP